MSTKDTTLSENQKQSVLCYEFDPKTDVLGKGAYGEVYRATYAGSPSNNDQKLDSREKVVAVKKTFCGNKEEGIPSSTIREVMVLKEISKLMQNVGDSLSSEMFGSENVVKPYDVCIDADTVFLVSEYCEGGDLSRYMRKLPMRRLSDGRQYRQWMWDMLSGLCFLHSKNFSHRDLKPENLVLKVIKCDDYTSDGLNNSGKNDASMNGQRYCLKITDFGLSRVEGIPVKKYQHECVTLWYRSPDVLLGNTNYGCTVDMWSAGCIIGEVATGRALFRGRNITDQLKCIFARLGAPTMENFPSLKQYALYKTYFNCIDEARRGYNNVRENCSKTCIVDVFESTKKRLLQYFRKHGVMNIVEDSGVDLITHLLAYEPKYRLTVQEALQHPFFSSLRRDVALLSMKTFQTGGFCPLTIKDYEHGAGNGDSHADGELSQHSHEEDCHLESI